MKVDRVLIVDDNPLNLELASFVLTAAGFAVDLAASASQIAPCVQAARPDVILMDIQMPGVDGLQATQRLKADPATCDIAIIAFTALAMKGDEDKMLAAGCDAYITKPIDVARFAQQVRDGLEATRRRLRATPRRP
jgi:two-component system cell cycle response regulator DivK